MFGQLKFDENKKAREPLSVSHGDWILKVRRGTASTGTVTLKEIWSEIPEDEGDFSLDAVGEKQTINLATPGVSTVYLSVTENGYIILEAEDGVEGETFYYSIFRQV